MAHNEKGFTLLESLLVLSIFILVVSFSMLFLKPHYLILEKHFFFSQLKADLLYAQQYALSTQKQVNVTFSDQNHFYYIRKYNGELLVKRNYSEDISVKAGTQPTSFRYTSRGNINSFGSLYIYFGKEGYLFTFLIGGGRFYVMKI